MIMILMEALILLILKVIFQMHIIIGRTPLNMFVWWEMQMEVMIFLHIVLEMVVVGGGPMEKEISLTLF